MVVETLCAQLVFTPARADNKLVREVAIVNLMAIINFFKNRLITWKKNYRMWTYLKTFMILI